MIELYGCQSCPDCRRVKKILEKEVFMYIDIESLTPQELVDAGLKTIPSIKKDGLVYNVKNWSKAELLELMRK